MKDLGKVKYVFGIEVAHGVSNMFLTQRNYALDIIDEMGMLGCKPVSTPTDLNHKLLVNAGPKCADPVKFSRLVGRLVYLDTTRGLS